MSTTGSSTFATNSTGCRFELAVGALVCLFIANPAFARGSASCPYPVVHVEEGSTRNTALIAYKAYEATLGEMATTECAQRYMQFLHDAAYAQQAAGNANQRAAADFREKELRIRHTLFEAINGTTLLRKLISIYQNNLRRLMDLYQFNGAGKEFLDDIIAEDNNFTASGYPLVTVRNTVRKAIYSCARWDFIHTKDLGNMKPRWAACRADFSEMAERIPRFKELAPAAARFLQEPVDANANPTP